MIENEERRLKAWDFVHCPPWTQPVFVGAGDGPCVIVMTGRRAGGFEVVYAVNEVAAKYGASVLEETSKPAEAYAHFGPEEHGVPEGWLLVSSSSRLRQCSGMTPERVGRSNFVVLRCN